MVFWETFGDGGTAQVFFGGQWWVVGFFVLILFIAFLIAYRVPYENIILLSVIGLITATSYSLYYTYAEQFTQTILFILLIFIGFVVYKFLNK